MEPTQNPLAFDSQGNLIIPGVHSDNYVAGSSGWSINKDGTAEFNHVVIRDGQGVSGTDLYYSGTPAAGNLIASVSFNGGVDAYGNHYVDGVAVYDFPNSNFSQMKSGFIYVGKISGGVPNTSTAAQLNVNPGALFIQGLSTIGEPVASNIQVTPGTDLAATGSANVPYVYFGNAENDGTVTDFVMSPGGSAYPLGETWHAPAMGVGWANGTGVGGSYPNLQWRNLIQNDFKVSGVFHATSTTPSTILGTGFPHIKGTNVSIVGNVGKVNSSGVTFSCYINNTGELRATALPAIAVNDTFQINGIVSIGDLS